MKDIYWTFTEVVKNSDLEMFDGIIHEDFIIEKEDKYEYDEISDSSKNEESSEDNEVEINNSLYHKDKDDDKDNGGGVLLIQDIMTIIIIKIVI